MADSENPIAHGFCDQRDSTHLSGPLPSSSENGELLEKNDYQYEWLGPGHFGGLISGLYPDGKRTIWSNGREQIVKLDYETLETLSTFDLSHERTDEVFSNHSEWEEGIAKLDNFDDEEELINSAIAVSYTHLTLPTILLV